MDYNYIFHSAVPDYSKFKSFGFEKQDDLYVCKKQLNGCGFYVVFKISPAAETFTAEVFENETDEKYILFDVKNANGAFLGGIREQVQAIVEDFRSECFESADLREKYEAYLKKEFNSQPDYPWAKSEADFTSAVYRCPNNKMFALIMDITYKTVGLGSTEKVSAVNLKVEPEKMQEVLNGKSIFPGYHMNKKYWVTVLLTNVTDWKKLEELTRDSYDAVVKK